MDLLAGQPRSRARSVKRSATRSRDVPALAQPDLVGAKSRGVHPDMLQMLRHRIAREEVAGRGKAQTRGIASLQLRLPGIGVAHDVGLEASLGLVDRIPEIRRRT